MTHGFDSPNNLYGLINHQRTAGTGDAWIRQREQPLGIINHQQTAATGDA